MRRSWIICILALSLLTACKSRKPEHEKAQTIQEEHSTIDETMGHGEIVGTVTVRGTLQHTKGSMGEVDRMIISGDFFKGSEGKTWKPEYEALVGKKVEARGEHYRYHCGPIEQCLEGGVINYLQKIEYLRAVE